MEDYNREGVSFEKIAHFMQTVFFGKTKSADVYLDKFYDFDVEKLRKLTDKKLHSILLDIDACIAPAYNEIIPENIQKIRELLSQIKIGIYSNCKAMERLNPLIEMGIPIYSGELSKPSKEGYLDACKEFGFQPDATWMVGENPATDGGAVGVLEGMAFVKPIPENNMNLGLKKEIILPFQKLFRYLAINATLKNNTNILKSSDLQKD